MSLLWMVITLGKRTEKEQMFFFHKLRYFYNKLYQKMLIVFKMASKW